MMLLLLQSGSLKHIFLLFKNLIKFDLRINRKRQCGFTVDQQERTV